MLSLIVLIRFGVLCALLCLYHQKRLQLLLWLPVVPLHLAMN